MDREILQTIIKNHPDIFVILLLHKNVNKKEFIKKYPKIFTGWPIELNCNGPDSNIKYRLNRNIIKKEKTYDNILDFIIEEEDPFNFHSNKWNFSWKTFSTFGQIRWDEKTINKFWKNIYWGINNKEQFGQFERDHFWLYSHDELWETIRLEAGGLSINSNLILNENLLDIYKDKWDFYALSHNYRINWDVSSFIKLKKYFINEEVNNIFKKHNKLIGENPNNPSYMPLIGNNIQINVYYKDGYLTSREPDYKFMLTLKILQNLKNECSENIINFFSSLSDFGDEYFRLVCLYEIDISSWECSPPLFEISTSFSNIDESFDYWFKNIDIESCKNYVESINIDHLNNVKNILQYSISYTKKSYRHKEINRPIERKDIDSSYCPRCNEDPCMCSDPDI